MADTDLGLTDREKELKKWEAPYRYQEFPKMLFRGMTTTQGRVEVERRIVAGEREETLAKESGWANSSAQAAAVETGRQEALGTAAAERAWDDRRVSAAGRGARGAGRSSDPHPTAPSRDAVGRLARC